MKLRVTVRRPSGVVEDVDVEIAGSKTAAEVAVIKASIISNTAAMGRGEVLEIVQVETVTARLNQVARRRRWLTDNADDLNWLGNKANQY